MKLHNKYALTKDVELQGYKTIKAGTKLEVIRFNKRYVYCIEPTQASVILQLTHKHFEKPKPKKSKASEKQVKNSEIDAFLNGENVSFK